MKRHLIIFLLVLVMCLPVPAIGDTGKELFYSRTNSVLRVREAKGSASFSAGSERGWEDVYENMPLTEGYSILTGNSGFVDVELDSETFIRMAEGSELRLVSIREGRVVIRYVEGSIYASRLSDRVPGHIIFELGIHGTIHFSGQGALRIDEEPGGTVTVAVREGSGNIVSRGEEFLVLEGDMARFGDGLELSGAFAKDSWDDFNEKRDNDVLAYAEGGYIEDCVPGRYDVDRYGEWIDTPVYGRAWRPYVTVAGWSPFFYGRWMFLSPFGWTWISFEPWGWITYHYGSWVTTSRYGWVWVPSVNYKVWYPARARIIVERESARWVPLRPGERLDKNHSVWHDRKHGRIINRKATFSKPVVVKQKKLFLAKDYAPILRRDDGRKLLARERKDDSRVIQGRRNRRSVGQGKREDSRRIRGDSKSPIGFTRARKVKVRQETEAMRAKVIRWDKPGMREYGKPVFRGQEGEKKPERAKNVSSPRVRQKKGKISARNEKSVEKQRVAPRNLVGKSGNRKMKKGIRPQGREKEPRFKNLRLARDR